MANKSLEQMASLGAPNADGHVVGGARQIAALQHFQVVDGLRVAPQRSLGLATWHVPDFDCFVPGRARQIAVPEQLQSVHTFRVAEKGFVQGVRGGRVFRVDGDTTF